MISTAPIIKNITDVVALHDNEMDKILSVLEERDFNKKEFVLSAGDVCRFQTYVMSGCLRIFYANPAGEEYNVKFAVENWWSFDLESFAVQTPAFYSIQALENSRCFQISKANHDRLCEQVPAMEKFTRTLYQNSYIMLQHRLTQNLYQTGEDKYEAFVAKYPGLELRISQKEIASYLGITPEFLSMLRRKRARNPIS
jgi:CRP-like cAMP-binding protein